MGEGTKQPVLSKTAFAAALSLFLITCFISLYCLLYFLVRVVWWFDDFGRSFDEMGFRKFFFGP